MSLSSRVAQRYMRKVSCGGNCGCGCSSKKTLEVEALPVEVELLRLGTSEGDDLHPEGENYMSVQALQAMVDHASSLLKKIDTSTNLPDWVEAKIIKASASLEDVMEYFAHGYGQRLASMYIPVVLKKDLKVMAGDGIPTVVRAGIAGNVYFSASLPSMASVGFDYLGSGEVSSSPLLRINLPAKNLFDYFGRPFTKVPSLTSLERMSDDGVASSVTGKRVEPDGFGPDGSPSWLLALGHI